MGTLSFVDPIGRGGLKRLFKLDPSSLINVFTLIAVLLTAIGKNTAIELVDLFEIRFIKISRGCSCRAIQISIKRRRRIDKKFTNWDLCCLLATI